MRKRFAVAAALPVAALAGLSWAVVAPGPAAVAADQAPPASCEPSGTALAITAADNKYDKNCLAAPAGQNFTIDFDNEDYGIPHNVAIYDKNNGDKALFKGDVTSGPDKTRYSVNGLPAGTYQFRCDPHPEFMFGTFTVK